MNELTGAVLVAQVRKLDEIIGSLHRIKARFRSQLEELPGLSFRKLNDPEGECSTLLTVILPKADVAERLAQSLGTTTVSKSGWHVYSNMEQILGKKMSSEHGCPYACDCYPCRQEYRKGMLPRTDEILARSINLSVGVVDRGLGAGFGIHPRSTDAEIEEKAREFTEAYKESTHA